MANKKIYIYTFYRFKDLKNIKSLKNTLNKSSKNKFILGTVLIASEGINGTISGAKKDLDLFIKDIKRYINIRKLSLKVSSNQFIPFYRLKIRLKKEIVTIGVNNIKPKNITGKHIVPKHWDKIIKNDDYLIIDTRNEYEINIGSFKNSVNPKTKSFRDFPNFINKSKINKKQPIAMFCTGGIRCEKASSYLLVNGYKNVLQLDGGILNYLEYKKNKRNKTWNGECFVFDNRVSINSDLKKGSYDQCYGCRHPINKKEMSSKFFKKGVHCPKCVKKRSPIQIKRAESRQTQIDLAEKKSLNNPYRKIIL